MVIVPSVPTRYDPVMERRVPSIDLRPAAVHGPLKVLLPDAAALSNENSEELFMKIYKGMEDITAEDVLVAVGDPILIAVAIAAACDRLGSIRVLRWDRRINDYEVIGVEL